MTRNFNPFSNAENFPEILEKNFNTLTGQKWAVVYLSPVCLSAVIHMQSLYFHYQEVLLHK